MRYRELHNQINTATPSILLFDEGGDQTINATGVFLTWDTVKSKTIHFEYTLDTDRVKLKSNSTGLFKITFETSVAVSTANTITFKLYKNGSVITGAETKMDCTAPQHGAITFYVYLEQGDYIQVYGIVDIATSTTVANTSRLLIEFLNMRGWDGSTGGRVDYKGGLER